MAVAHGFVLPEPPVVTSASPLAMLPIGTYATNPECGSQLNVLETSSGSMMIPRAVWCHHSAPRSALKFRELANEIRDRKAREIGGFGMAQAGGEVAH